MRVCGRIRVRKLRNGLRTFPRSSIRIDDFFQFREKVFGFFFWKKPPRNPFNFEIHLYDHCNLNCKSCFYFVPLAKPDSYYPLDEFERGIKRLCSLFDGKLAGFTSSAWGSSGPISASRRTNACVPCLCSPAGEAENGRAKPTSRKKNPTKFKPLEKARSPSMAKRIHPFEDKSQPKQTDFDCLRRIDMV